MAKAATKKAKIEKPKAKSDAYVMMLFVTFVSIVTGAVLMYLDFAGTKELGIGEDEGYSNKRAPTEPVPTALPKLGESLKLAEPPPEPKKEETMPMPEPMPEPKPEEPKKDEPKKE
ncbi:MAG: hypothetical protein K8U57_19225 [Planctomycetes bacterium]|nr:hypothetical protein [Planctomycetota bacterium]